MLGILIGLGAFFIIFWGIVFSLALWIKNVNLTEFSFLMLVFSGVFVLASLGGYAISNLIWMVFG